MANYVLIQRIELLQNNASVEFLNIPQSGFTDLKMVYSARSDSSADDYLGIKYSFNSSSTSFTIRQLYGVSTTAGSGNYATNNPSGYMQAVLTTANTFASGETYIPNYTSNNNKSFLTDSVTENNALSPNIVSLLAGLWSNSAAISSITLTPAAGNFVKYSTFSLYGIAATGTTPIAAKAYGGDIVRNDGTYWYHAFLKSGTFTPTQALSCDLLTIAGGGGGGGCGGGGYSGGGGGGAGGLSYQSAQSFAASNYTVTVGAGGNGGRGISSSATSGSNSQITGFTAAVGGGYGGTYLLSSGNAANGGSGGGASYGGTFGTATSGQGNNGGARTGDAGGGGGGAGAVGQTAPSVANGGNGGAGVNTYSSWATQTYTGVSGYYAGGGGGGAYGSSSGTNGSGGAGGGGAGITDGTATAGTANTGGGGGAAGAFATYGVGGAGGSGIVIIRYAV